MSICVLMHFVSPVSPVGGSIVQVLQFRRRWSKAHVRLELATVASRLPPRMHHCHQVGTFRTTWEGVAWASAVEHRTLSG